MASGWCPARVLLTPRWGVGVAWRKLDDVTFGRGRVVSSFSQTEREHALFTLAMFRALRGRWGAIDVVGGPGFVRQHVMLTVASSFPTTVRRLTRPSPRTRWAP